MTIKEVATLLKWSKGDVQDAIQKGVQLPKSQRNINLKAEFVSGRHDISDDALDSFIDAFESEEPGRHPPVAVRRQLLIESYHRCSICRELTPIEYHHIIEFSKLKHHDPKHMLAICPNCHTLCGTTIDRKAQDIYKRELSNRNPYDAKIDLTWDDLRDIVVAFHHVVCPGNSEGSSKYDFSLIDLEDKNRLNRMSEEYFANILDHHEPFFGRINGFLQTPVNNDLAQLYHEVVDELRSNIAALRANHIHFEHFLLDLGAKTVTERADLRRKRRTLNILLSFMYVNCDIGRKT